MMKKMETKFVLQLQHPAFKMKTIKKVETKFVFEIKWLGFKKKKLNGMYDFTCITSEYCGIIKV